MAKLTWLGDSDPSAQVITQNGVTFVRGEAVEVKDKKLADKLATNPMFSTDAKPEVAEADEPNEEEVSARAEAGTVKGHLKEQLRAYGVTVAGNPSEETLRGKLADAVAKANG